MNVIPLKSKYFLLITAVIYSVLVTAQTPAVPQTKSILLMDATAHIGNGEVIPRAAIGFREGKIDMVLAAFDIRMDSTRYDTVIHLPGKHIYPGFIAPNSTLGLVEVEAVRASVDKEDVGKFKPHVRSITAYNTESRVTPTIRTNGILMAEITPRGGLISGTSSIVELDAWNWEDALLKEDNGIHVFWPSENNSLGVEKKEDEKNLKQYTKQVNELKVFFREADAYRKADFQLEKNVRFESMKAIFSKQKKVFLHANQVQEITDAIYLFDDFDFDVVLVGGNDAWMIADLLKDRDIPIILRRVHSLPMNEDDDIDLPYRLPKVLYDKGLLVALENSGDMEAMGTRNLPFYAGTAVAYGMEKEQALSMITLNTAKILGIDKRVGSLEKGKLATLFVSEGDALDMRTNQVKLAFIKGKQIKLTNPQIQLYKKYSKKYE